MQDGVGGQPDLGAVRQRRRRATGRAAGKRRSPRAPVRTARAPEEAAAERSDLLIEKSTFVMPGRRTASVRGEVPKRPNGTCAKPAVLNQAFQVRWSAGRSPRWPATRSGRELMPVPVVSMLDVTGAGKP